MADWRYQAACLGADPDMFFPASKKDATKAKRFCSRCPVMAECLTEAIRNNERGVWGGIYLGSDTAKEIKVRSLESSPRINPGDSSGGLQ